MGKWFLIPTILVKGFRMEEQKHKEGYLRTVPTIDKMTVTNLVNFTETRGLYSGTESSLKRAILILLIILLHFFSMWVLYLIIKIWWLVLPLTIILLPIPLRIISLFVFKEMDVAKEYKERNGSVKEDSYLDFFSAYDMMDKYPYILYHRDGTLSVVIELVRRTQVGGVKKKAFKHANVLSEFYNQAFKLGLIVTVLDVQASNKRDTRFDDLYDSLSDVKNGVIESVRASMYQHLEENSNRSELTYEYFSIRTYGSEVELADNLLILMGILRNGYKRVAPMPKDKISDLVVSLFGLEEFKINQAMQEVAYTGYNTSLKLLWIGDNQGRRKVINQSREEIQAKMESSLSKGKVNSSKKKEISEVGVDKELLDLFGNGEQSEVDSMTTLLDGNSESDKLESDTSIDLFEG